MISLLGIRHHGPGSARSVRQALESLRPDCILVEGPPDADSLLPLVGASEMQPPVAILLYLPDSPQNAVYYPFAEFSPEWQAIQYALENQVPVRFMDLAQKYQLGRAKEDEKKKEAEKEESASPDSSSSTGPFDPFALIAEAAGYSDGERWWEHFVEQRREAGQVFAGILELMTALRAEAEKQGQVEPRDLVREASMRTILRAAQAEGRQNIAIVCGAWHTPALAQPGNAQADQKLLADFLRTAGIKADKEPAIESTFIPWTYTRLSYQSGYGAGIESPGWYEHLWHTQKQIVETWMVKVSQLMRAQDLGISPAHAIEATRLAETLAALRGRPLPGLPELDEAIQSIYCLGDDAPMRLIREKLIIGDKMGHVPPAAPAVPLQRDIAATQKRIQLPASASPETIDLDLRKPRLLERSQLLHRLNLLGIPWGKLKNTHNTRSTFHELWQIEWKPEFAILVVEASLWGNTVLEAATAKTQSLAAQANQLPHLTGLIESALLADLGAAIPGLLARLQQIAAASADMAHLMAALPPLVNVLRYGSVRQTDTSLVQHVVDELITRICIGLPSACTSLNDDAATEMFELIKNTHSAIALLADGTTPGQEIHTQAWQRALASITTPGSGHGLTRGLAARLLYDSSNNEETPPQAGDGTMTRMSIALSPGTPAPEAAAWVQGFLHSGGQALIHHAPLWQLLNDWVTALPEEQFTNSLPLLRRTFSTFPAPERRQLGEIAKTGHITASSVETLVDPARAEKALALIHLILQNN